MGQQRYLIVIADDFGIGPETTRGILELAGRGLVTGSVMLVNSPYALGALKSWRQAGAPMELGWHPCLTLDKPILPPAKIPSLVSPSGTFWPLGPFLKRLFLGRIAAAEIQAELRAQFVRFCDWFGHPPTIVNAHQHTNVFHPVGSILLKVLHQQRPLPYVRRIQEPYRTLLRISGARKKRLFLSVLGKPLARWQKSMGFPGNDWLMGITDPRWVKDAEFFVRWLKRVPGEVVELGCHPGHADATLVGRDCQAHDGLLQRRVDEFHLMNVPAFLNACRQLGFVLLSPGEWSRLQEDKTKAA